MKMFRHLLLLFLCTLCAAPLAARKVKQPRVDYSPTWIHVDELETTRKGVTLHCRLQNLPGYWVKVNAATVLKDAQGRSYRLLRLEGVEADRETYMPESGSVPCKLHFEPVPEEVEVVDMIGKGTKPEGQMYGIHLKKSKREQAEAAGGLSAADFLRLPGASPLAPADSLSRPDPAWRFAPERYADPSFLRPGRARLVVHVGNVVPALRAGVETGGLRVYDVFAGNEQMLTAPLDSAGRYTFDVSLAGAGFVTVTPFFENVFLQPGDTLHLFTTLERTSLGAPRYVRYQGNSESARISALWSEVARITGVARDRAFYGDMRRAAEQSPDSVMAFGARLGRQLDRVLESEAVRREMAALPLSPFGRSLLLTSAACAVASNLEDLNMLYDDNVSAGALALDTAAFYAPLLRHKAALLDNALVLCEQSQWVFINRMAYSPLFVKRYSFVRINEDGTGLEFADDFDVASTLFYDLLLGHELVKQVESWEESWNLGRISGREVMLACLQHEMAVYMAAMKRPQPGKAALAAYTDFMGRLLPDARAAAYPPDQQALLDKLVKPYRGNLVVIDFWGMGCGPCRAGMKRQRAIVEALKNRPVRFLYVCNEADSPREASEKWMGENKIEGEHLYVSAAEWKRLNAMFNFSAIPFAVLIDGEGRVVQRDFSIPFEADDFEGYIKRFVTNAAD